ncbi:hypothetical protein [Mucilaginibacter sp. OK098]|uniref:hypothetical protein n=1 Tax=Mucilaginibacter sp. OK098 TaxID=1855297 RepID=UPI0009201F1A|nr:hypothetical protein [Mucilaginibacter sp. OK098]SHM49282.1 hypothetical protein SAMN05216524_102286 [Mucilaginibacter sp. OK098]
MKLLLYIPEFFGISAEVYVILIVLAVPVFFIWRRIWKKRIATTSSRRITIWVLTMITTPLLYVGIVIITMLVMEYYPKRDFDRNEWLNNKDDRYEYSGDIIDSKMLIGKSKSEVIKILGDDGNEYNNNDWYYPLGFRPELGNIDPDSLEIDFKNDKVINVVQHKR